MLVLLLIPCGWGWSAVHCISITVL